MSSYDGQDLLADVFPDTEDAPEPAAMVDVDGNLIRLCANPDDPRWSVELSRWPNGNVAYVHSVVPRETA